MGVFKLRAPGKKAPDHIREKAIKTFWETEFWSNKAGCWLWPKSVASGGYGGMAFSEGGKSNQYHFTCHRLSWEIHHGAIPENQWVLHKCDERRCCNPDHLFLGSEEDNWKDMYSKKRNPRGERHPNAKLNADQVAEIKWHLAQGRTSASLARQYGVAEGTIGNIKQGNNWPDVKAKAPVFHAADTRKE